MDSVDKMLTVGEVAERLGVAVSWVYTAVESGRMPSYRLGKYRRISSKEFEAWLHAQRAVPTVPQITEVHHGR